MYGFQNESLLWDSIWKIHKGWIYITGLIPCRMCVSLGSQAGSLEVLLVGNADIHARREQLCFLVSPLCGHWKWSRHMTKTAFQAKMASGTAILKQLQQTCKFILWSSIILAVSDCFYAFLSARLFLTLLTLLRPEFSCLYSLSVVFYLANTYIVNYNIVWSVEKEAVGNSFYSKDTHFWTFT